MRWALIAAGVLLLAVWIGCWAATVVPGSRAVIHQWIIGNASAFFAGIAFGGAACMRRNA